MAINLYSKKEIKILRAGGKILSETLRQLAAEVKVGISTYELDRLAEQLIKKQGAKPAFLGYEDVNGKPYPASLCTSINEELVHNLPYKNRRLAAGDIVSLDLGVLYQGLNTDMAVTVPVGKVSLIAKKLIEVTKESLDVALAQIRPGATVGDIGHAVQTTAESQGFSVIRSLVGHGVGRKLHEEPAVPNFGKPGTGLVLKEGMVLAIEPMLAEKSHEIEMKKDGWGIVMKDKGLSSHFEKTITVTKNGCLGITP